MPYFNNVNYLLTLLTLENIKAFGKGKTNSG